jgi:hypothetical protein
MILQRKLARIRFCTQTTLKFLNLLPVNNSLVLLPSKFIFEFQKTNRAGKIVPPSEHFLSLSEILQALAALKLVKRSALVTTVST